MKDMMVKILDAMYNHFENCENNAWGNGNKKAEKHYCKMQMKCWKLKRKLTTK